MIGADLLDDSCYRLLCDCCGRDVDYVRGSMWHGEHRICRACFYVWYDGGCADPEKIKEYVLHAAAAGTWPFDDKMLTRDGKLPPKV